MRIRGGGWCDHETIEEEGETTALTAAAAVCPALKAPVEGI